MTSGHIVSYEKKNGEVFVAIGDKFGDCHIFLIENSGVSIEQTLEVLKVKKAELEGNMTVSSPAGGTISDHDKRYAKDD
ncbi:MAG: hypothetical protein KKB51_18165 [Candidatus Riflebacteria bacterium]|nr:hypothetical protein [Candidatus Riflebacteria bacterium]